MNINALGANQRAPASRQEQGLQLVISTDEKKLAVLEARRVHLLQELDCVGEEITAINAQLEKAEDLAKS